MRYTEEQAAAYQSIELDGSTFAISLIPAITTLGGLSRKTVLDFGAGAGRSARALQKYGADHVVAVDKNANMLSVARQHLPIVYLQIGQVLPLKDQSIDAALCANVLQEFSTLDDMLVACREVWRVLKENQVFAAVVPNPSSIFADFVSTRYINVTDLKSGSPITCLLKGDKPTLIQDYYWTQENYTSVLETAGFKIDELLLPTASADENGWLDETRVAPDLVIRAIRITRLNSEGAGIHTILIPAPDGELIDAARQALLFVAGPDGVWHNGWINPEEATPGPANH